MTAEYVSTADAARSRLLILHGIECLQTSVEVHHGFDLTRHQQVWTCMETPSPHHDWARCCSPLRVAEMLIGMLTLQFRSIVLFRSALAQSLGPASDLGAPVQFEN